MKGEKLEKSIFFDIVRVAVALAGKVKK